MIVRLSMILMWALLALTFTPPVLAQSAKPEADNQKKLLTLATEAAGAKDYCNASFYFEWVYETSLESKHLYNAAEVAFAANDRGRAVALYRRIKLEHEEFSKLDTVVARMETLGALMVDDGPGTACKTPPNPLLNTLAPEPDNTPARNKTSEEIPTGKVEPKCGNGIVDEGETCDDQNKTDDDGCNNLCVDTSLALAEPASKVPPLITAGAGGTLLAAGLGGLVYGFLPRLAYRSSKSELDAVVDAYNNTDDGNAKEALQEDARRLQATLQNHRADYDDRQLIRLGGLVASVVGAAILTGGIVWLSVSGE